MIQLDRLSIALNDMKRILFFLFGLVLRLTNVNIVTYLNGIVPSVQIFVDITLKGVHLGTMIALINGTNLMIIMDNMITCLAHVRAQIQRF